MNDFIKVALAAAKKAALIIKISYEKPFELANKNPKDIKDYVTNIDKEAERLIRNEIAKHFPQHSIIGEEFGEESKTNKYKWTIDPIDGTKNFIRHLGQFAISIGVSKEDKPFAGLIYDPLDDASIWAMIGKGAYVNNNKIQLSRVSRLENACIAVNLGKTKKIREKTIAVISKLLNIVPIIRMPGSTAFAIKDLIQGKYDALIDNGNYWDWAASLVIVKEVGGIVTTWDGNEVNENSKYVLWSNGFLHYELLSYLKE